MPQQDQKLMLLYPVDILLGQHFYKARNLSMFDIQVSLIEFETSFKQVFTFHLLFKKIVEACKPVTQIFEFIDTHRPSSSGQMARADPMDHAGAE